MEMEIYRPRRRKRYPLPVRVRHYIEHALRMFILLVLMPAPATTLIGVIWYEGFYHNRLVEIVGKAPDAAVVSWFGIFGVLYVLIAGVIVGKVYDEFKRMREAVKKRDFPAFMALRDEDVSPAIHAWMTLSALMILLAFAVLPYGNALSGLVVICSSTYMFSIVWWVINEFDDPCEGLWFIRHVDPEWLRVDAEKWREQLREEIPDTWSVCLVETTVLEPPSPPTLKEVA